MIAGSPPSGGRRGEVPGFRPSVHGLAFANAFPPGPTLRLGPLDSRMLGFGDASAGLCGGMVLTARDLWAAGLRAPGGTTPPASGSPRFRALVRRQVESLDWLRVPLRYLDLQACRPDPPGRLARLVRLLHREPPRVEAVLREWPRIRSELEGGRPAPVGLVRVTGISPWHLTRNHQVLAWAWTETPDGFAIGVYDPNHPGRDDVVLRARLTPGTSPWSERIRLEQSTGEVLLGFFLAPCPSPRPVRAWR